MNEFYTRMLKENGSRCVWMEKDLEGEDEHCFSMGNGLLNSLDGMCEGEDFEEYCEGNDNIKCISPQDEVMNCVVVKDCTLLTEKEKEFIEEWIGSNCYT